MTAMSGGEALVQSIVREGVEVIFGIPGIHMSGIITALRDEPRIRMITTRHEQAAAHMADGYARVSGKPGVILVVPGAGGYNAATGLATAYARSAPVLAIAGQIPRDHIGRGFGTFHAVLDQSSIVQPVTKWRQQALTPREIPAAVSEAFRQMRTGRPRPTLIEIPPEAGVERDLDDLFGGTYETDLLNPDFVKFAESFGAVGLRANHPLELDTLLPRALELQAPVIIDVPIGDMPLPRPKFLAALPSLPWTRPQAGLIQT